MGHPLARTPPRTAARRRRRRPCRAARSRAGAATAGPARTERVGLQHAERHRDDRPVDRERLARVEAQAHPPVVVGDAGHDARDGDVDGRRGRRVVGEAARDESPGSPGWAEVDAMRRELTGRRARRRRDAARDRVREPVRGADAVGVGRPRHREHARADERGRERDVGLLRRRPRLRRGDRVGAGRRDRHRDAVGRARLDDGGERSGVDGCRAESVEERVVVTDEHGAEFDRLVEAASSTESTRPPTRSRASSTTTSKPASTSARAAVSPARPAPMTATRSPGSATADGGCSARARVAARRRACRGHPDRRPRRR